MSDLPSSLGGLPFWGKATLILLLLIALWWGVKALPVRGRAQRVVLKALPYLEAIALLWYLGWLLAQVVDLPYAYGWILLPIGLGLVLLVSWFVFKDFIAGVVLRSEHGFEPGRWLRAGTHEGRILRVGMRTLVLASDEGISKALPYSLLQQLPLDLETASRRLTPHAIELTLSDEIPSVEAIRLVRKCALNTFWIALSHPPQISRLEPTGRHSRFAVTFYVLGEEYAAAAEADIRQALSPHLVG